MACTPVIETKRLLIVPFTEEYLTLRYLSWLNDPEVVRYSEQRFHPHTLESCRAYWNSFNGTPNYFWAIMMRASQPEHIGNMNAYVDTVPQTADIGILIGERSKWGQGYGIEAWLAVCNYLLYQTKIQKITAGTLSVNKAMLKIMRKAGMVTDDQIPPQCVIFEGQEVEVIRSTLQKNK
ncbi:MAG: GNAT family N-acetyltransferase [Anaerolineae bacterium]